MTGSTSRLEQTYTASWKEDEYRMVMTLLESSTHVVVPGQVKGHDGLQYPQGQREERSPKHNPYRRADVGGKHP